MFFAPSFYFGKQKNKETLKFKISRGKFELNKMTLTIE